MLRSRRVLGALLLASLIGLVPSPAHAEGKCFSDPAGDQVGGSGDLDVVEVCHGNTADTITYRLKMGSGFENPQQAEIGVFLNLQGAEFQMEAAIALAFLNGEGRIAVFANPDVQPGQTLNPQTLQPQSLQPPVPPRSDAESPQGVAPAIVDEESAAPADANPAPNTDLDLAGLAAWQDVLRSSGWGWLAPAGVGDEQFLDLAAQARAAGFDVPSTTREQGVSASEEQTAAEQPTSNRVDTNAVSESSAPQASVEAQAQADLEPRQAQVEPPRIEGTNAQFTHDPGSDTITITINSAPLRAHGLGVEGERYEYVVATNDGAAADKAPNEALFLHNLEPPGDVPPSGQAEAPPTAEQVRQATGQQAQSGDAGDGNLPRNGAYIDAYLRVAVALIVCGAMAMTLEAVTKMRWRAEGLTWEAGVSGQGFAMPGLRDQAWDAVIAGQSRIQSARQAAAATLHEGKAAILAGLAHLFRALERPPACAWPDEAPPAPPVVLVSAVELEALPFPAMGTLAPARSDMDVLPAATVVNSPVGYPPALPAASGAVENNRVDVRAFVRASRAPLPVVV